MNAIELRFALIHSPLVGPSCWRDVERSLRLDGHDALAVDYGPIRGAGWYGEAAARIAAGLGDGRGRWILVGNSGAGGLIPSIVEAARGLVSAVVFIDAILPHAGRTWLETAPGPLAERLRGLASDGRLPPWNEWFDADPTLVLIPDKALRAALVADLPCVALAALSAPAPSGGDWEALPCLYLQLSAAYASEAREARRRGWRVCSETMHHLAMVTEPERAGEILVQAARALVAP